jgi:hypothetical protein
MQAIHFPLFVESISSYCKISSSRLFLRSNAKTKLLLGYHKSTFTTNSCPWIKTFSTISSKEQEQDGNISPQVSIQGA